MSEENAQGAPKTTSVKLPPDLDARLNKAVSEWDGDKSKFIRNAIEEFLLFLDEVKDLKAVRTKRRAAEEVERQEGQAEAQSAHPHVVFPYSKKSNSVKPAKSQGTKDLGSKHLSTHPKGK